MNGRRVNTSRPQARRAWLLALGLPLVLSVVACTGRSRPGAQASGKGAANRSADPLIEVSPVDSAAASDDPCSEMFSNFFLDVDSISYNGYEVVRIHKTIRDSDYGGDIAVTYATLKSGGRTIATFDGPYYFRGDNTGFGLASLLGGETKQLVVS